MSQRSVDSIFGRRSSLVRTVLLIYILSTFAIFCNGAVSWLGITDPVRLVETAPPIVLLIFVLAAAIPFVPGAEIGFAMLMILGADVAIEVYLSMVVALSLAYCFGRCMPVGALDLRQSPLASRLRLLRKKMRTTRADKSITFARRVAGLIAANRYLALCFALNTPGNSVLGGGGGLAMMAGASRQYTPFRFLLTIAIAVMPIPLGVAIL